MCLKLGVVASALTSIQALIVQEKSVEGTEVQPDGFSQKQLAMLRNFAHQTFMTEQDEDPWKPWYVDGKLPGDDGGGTAFGDLRYQMSHVAYATGIAAQRIFAYTEIHAKILKSVSRRMLENKVWKYAANLYPKDKTNSGSDPLRFKNIMYSAHLAKVMALLETISGDMAFSENTWDFKYKDAVSTYNLTGTMDAMYNQMFPPGGMAPEWGTWYKGGGVPCEPVMIFLLCNTFPHNAFHMHDGIHGTHYQDSDKRWQDEIRAHAVNKQPDEYKEKTKGAYFKIGYMNAIRTWVAQAPIQGGDSWALAWIRGWWNETDPADKEVIFKGFEHLNKHQGWTTDKVTGGEYHKGEPGTFDFITTSFYPMIERQFWTQASGFERRSDNVLKYMEQFGELIDTDNDGVKDSYRYVKSKDGYRDASNANLLAGMIFPNDGSSNGILRDLMQATPPFYQIHAHEPRIVHAEYPAVMVLVARFDKATNVLNFQLVAGDKPMTEKTIQLANCQGLSGVTLDGKAFTDYTQKVGKVTINVPKVTNTSQVWQVAFKGDDVQV
jgi:hypothetical protein